MPRCAPIAGVATPVLGVLALAAAAAGLARFLALDHLVVWHAVVFTLVRALATSPPGHRRCPWSPSPWP